MQVLPLCFWIKVSHAGLPVQFSSPLFEPSSNLGGVTDAALFTGHSFRRGGATWAFQAGIPGELIQICGDWASDAYKRYLEFSMDDKLNLAAQFVRHLSLS